jgi:hypothetical protein
MSAGWVIVMKFGNQVVRSDWDGSSGSGMLHSLGLLPAIPWNSSIRDKIADALLALFVLSSRLLFIVGGIVGNVYAGGKGLVIGIFAGGVVGFWIRRSVGIRGRDLTHGFFIRMSQRGVGSSPALLEWLVEKVRGQEITAYQCRLIASAYAEFQRALQACGSVEERDELCKTLTRSVRAALYGKTETVVGAADKI